MPTPSTHGPVYRTTDVHNAFDAWQVDETQWIMTNTTAYLVGYAPAIFRDAPMAQGWRITSPEALLHLCRAD